MVGLVVLADVETHGDLGRVVNALMTAKEFKEAGDEVQIVFDGAGTQWPGVLSDEGHRAHRLYDEVADTVRGACGYCAHAVNATLGCATLALKAAGAENLDGKVLQDLANPLDFTRGCRPPMSCATPTRSVSRSSGPSPVPAS